MPRAIIPEPPYSKDTELYQWMLEIHKNVFGIGADVTGNLDDDNLSDVIPNITDTETISGVWTFSAHPLGLDHTKIANIGTNTHVQIDTYIADDSLHVPAHIAEADPHTQYRLESEDHTHQSTGLQGGKLDHGLALDGLADDDHPQYLLKELEPLSLLLSLM